MTRKLIPISFGKLIPIFFKDGWLTAKGRWAVSASGWTLIGLPIWLAHQKIISGQVAFISFSIGIAVAQIANYEAKAKQFKYQPPFTADPTGWRQAKKTYQVQEAANGPTSP